MSGQLLHLTNSMTDDMLGWQTKRFQELALNQTGHVVALRPEIVSKWHSTACKRARSTQEGSRYALHA